MTTNTAPVVTVDALDAERDALWRELVREREAGAWWRRRCTKDPS